MHLGGVTSFFIAGGMPSDPVDSVSAACNYRTTAVVGASRTWPVQEVTPPRCIATTTLCGQPRLRCLLPLLPNESRLSCGALKKDSFLNLRAPPASSAC